MRIEINGIIGVAVKKKIAEFVNRPKMLRRIFNWYGPFWGAGIHIDYICPNFTQAKVSMKLRWYNTNYVGVHFGGSLYSMTDPFYMLLTMNRLGNDYIVWDKAAEIEFIRPGTGTVSATFEVTDAMLEDIRKHTGSGDKYLPCYSVDVYDEAGERVARVKKTLYIRRKPGK